MSTFLNEVSQASGSSGFTPLDEASTKGPIHSTAEKVALLPLTANSSSPIINSNKIAGLLSQIESLQSTDHFIAESQTVRYEVQTQKSDLLGAYKQICGECFEDVESPIHQLWAKFVHEEQAYNKTAEVPFDQMNPSIAGVDSAVYAAFVPFLKLDLEARSLYQQIIDLGGTYTSDSVLKEALFTERETLVQSDIRLCGSSNDDLSAPLPKARREYEESLLHSSDSSALLETLKQLEKQHAVNVRNIYLIDQMIAAPVTPENTVDAIVQRKIEADVARVQSQIERVQKKESKKLASPSTPVLNLNSPPRSDTPSSLAPVHTPTVEEHGPDRLDQEVPVAQIEQRTQGAFERAQDENPTEKSTGFNWSRVGLVVLTVIAAPIAAYGVYKAVEHYKR
ncbi:MAG: hypothetical protein JSR39_00515 [Verrucomicrobia bacterium]|nr:hypothetical protein [Verrucomicrobiota bacterium]